jgi:hypothetical protein
MAKQNLRYAHFLFAFLPFLFTPALAYLLAEGFLSSSDKNIVLVVPYILWASTYLVVSAVLITKRWDFGAWVKRSLIISFSSMLSLCAIFFGLQFFGDSIMVYFIGPPK